MANPTDCKIYKGELSKYNRWKNNMKELKSKNERDRLQHDENGTPATFKCGKIFI